MSDTAPVRTNYFSGEALLTADFICEQHYHMDMLARANRSLHTYGIAAGLDVRWQTDGPSNLVRVEPGMAIDGVGRQIVLAQAQVVTFTGVQPGTYYLTICYDEVYDDLSEESGVRGYKRVVQRPKIQYERTFRDPATNILLGVVTFSAQDRIGALAYRAGVNERRYVGAVSGALDLVAEGTGIAVGDGASGRDSTRMSIRLSARSETGGVGGDYLAVDAPRAEFSGQLTARGNLGIGALHPDANLQVDGIVFQGPGTMTTSGTLLTLSHPIDPPLQVGDLIMPHLPAGRPAASPRQVAIRATTSSALQYVLQPGFLDDIVAPYPYRYIRSALARFSSPTRGTVLALASDGAVGLGVQGPGTGTGPHALTITPDGQVRIGVKGAADAEPNLAVSGTILTDALDCNGKVTAQSFAGNGSKLTDLNFVSDWTRQKPTAPDTAIYYLPGNVGVRMTNPPGSLSVGTGPARVGSGLVTIDPKDHNVLHGFQTLFTREIASGDAITVGDLVPQRQRIATIVSDTELQLAEQFPLVVQDSKYRTMSPGAAAAPAQARPLSAQLVAPTPADGGTPGAGTISTVGTRVIGDGTKFSSLAAGDFLIIDRFEIDPNRVATWLVETVTDDVTLKLIVPTDQAGATFPANNSAYAITRALMGLFQSNQDDDAKPPAMVIVANGPAPTGITEPANTVAINVPLDKVDSTYALQVEGLTEFSGGVDLDHLQVKTLVATTSIEVDGDGTSDALLKVGEANGHPLLTVTKTNVVVGDGKPGGALLDVGGGIAATTLVATTSIAVDGDGTGDALLKVGEASGHPLLTVTKTNVVVGDGNPGGALLDVGAGIAAKSLAVSGVTVEADGSVGMLGHRTRFTDRDLQNGNFSRTAATDGIVIAYLLPPLPPANSAGLLFGITTSAGATSSEASTFAGSYLLTVSTGKKSSSGYWFPMQGQLTLTVRKGEVWTMQLQGPAAFGINDGSFQTPSLSFSWTPFGSQTAPVPDLPQGPGPLSVYVESFLAAARQSIAAGPPGDPLAARQQTIDARVRDFARIFADAAGMSAAEGDRATFVGDLQKIVCTAIPRQPADSATEAADIAAVIDAVARFTHRDFSPEQQSKAIEAVRGLLAINANERNRQDLGLIRTSINRFLDDFGAILGRPFDADERRLMTRALVRLVGDGTRSPEQIDDRGAA